MMDNKNYVIYKAINTINQKIYIGASTKDLISRKLDHLERAARGQNGKLYEDIRAYDSESFIWQVIDTAESINELAKKEKYWIKFFDSVDNGYNADSGGGFKKNVYQYSIESRELLNCFIDLKSAASACNANKQDISRAALSVNKEFAGFLWSYDEVEVLPLPDDQRRKKVIQLDLEGNWINEFESIAEASRSTLVSKSCIARVCRKERRSTKGSVWIFQE